MHYKKNLLDMANTLKTTMEAYFDAREKKLLAELSSAYHTRNNSKASRRSEVSEIHTATLDDAQDNFGYEIWTPGWTPAPGLVSPRELTSRLLLLSPLNLSRRSSIAQQSSAPRSRGTQSASVTPRARASPILTPHTPASPRTPTSLRPPASQVASTPSRLSQAPQTPSGTTTPRPGRTNPHDG